jgi:CubicO group peptidase (beta-lactamase class C family)
MRASSSSAGTTGNAIEALRSVAESAMAELGVPGVSLWLLADGEEDGFQLGVTSVDNPLPVDEDTVFQAGSITKTLTATAAVRLAQRGRLDLDLPVRRYLPELRLADEGVASEITMRDLLSHGGGSSATGSRISAGATTLSHGTSTGSRGCHS